MTGAKAIGALSALALVAALLVVAVPSPAAAHHCGPTQPLPEYPRHSCRSHTQTWQPGERVDQHPGGAGGRGGQSTIVPGQSVHCQREADGRCVCGPRRGTGRNIPCRPEQATTQPPPPPPPQPPQRQARSVEVTLATVAWISMRTNPFDGYLGGSTVAPWTGPMRVPLYQPEWLIKTYLGLVATQNVEPPSRIASMTAFQGTRNFRALLYGRFRITFDPRTSLPRSERIEWTRDPGWTPPFNRDRFPPSYLLSLDPAFSDQTWHTGEFSSITAIDSRRHLNSALGLPPGEYVLAHGLIKFRAGQHTDNIGVEKVGAPFHVPWVWNELALTYSDGTFHLRGAASLFPTTWWYWNGEVVKTQNETVDQAFPITGPGIGMQLPPVRANLDLPAMKIYPVLAAGAPASAPQIPRVEQPRGPVDTHPHTAQGGAPWWLQRPVSGVGSQATAR